MKDQNLQFHQSHFHYSYLRTCWQKCACKPQSTWCFSTWLRKCNIHVLLLCNITSNDWWVGVDRGGVIITSVEHGDATPAGRGTHGDLWSVPTGSDAFNLATFKANLENLLPAPDRSDSLRLCFLFDPGWSGSTTPSSLQACMGASFGNRQSEEACMLCKIPTFRDAFRFVQSWLCLCSFDWPSDRLNACYRVAQRRCFLSFEGTEIRGTPGCVMLLHISRKLLGLTECTTCRHWFLWFNDMSLDSVQPCFNVSCLLCPNRGCWNFSQQLPGERQGQRTTSTTGKWKTVSEIQTLRARLSCSPV